MTESINNEYIYIRKNEWWDIYDVIKIGKTKNSMDRESSYITSEIKRGIYVLVLRVKDCDIIEKDLKNYFIKYNIKFDAGTEFFTPLYI